MTDLSKFYAKPKQYLIGNDLPDSEKLVIQLYSPGLDDLDLVMELLRSKTKVMVEQPVLNDDGEPTGVTVEKELMMFDMKIARKLLAKMLRTKQEEVDQIDSEYFEEFFEAMMDRLSKIQESDDKSRALKLAEELKARGKPNPES